MIPSDRLEREAKRAAFNSCQSLKRSLLDYVEYTVSMHVETLPVGPTKTRAERLMRVLAKRIHNDVSTLSAQMYCIIEILKSGGNIPPFGLREAPDQQEMPEVAETGLSPTTGPGGMPELMPSAVVTPGFSNGARIR